MDYSSKATGSNVSGFRGAKNIVVSVSVITHDTAVDSSTRVPRYHVTLMDDMVTKFSTLHL